MPQSALANLLPMIVLLPMLGALVSLMLPNGVAARYAALFWSGVTLLLTLALPFNSAGSIDMGGVHYALLYRTDLLSLASPEFGIKLGLDRLGFWLLLINALLVPIAILASDLGRRGRGYYAWLLLLAGAVNGVLLSRDLLLFYVFFELTLLPTFFLISEYGGPERKLAALKYFLFNFTGSIFMLGGVVYLGVKAGTFDLAGIAQVAQDFGPRESFWVMISLLAGFLVKGPLFPFHTWLPTAHQQTPSSGAVDVASLVLKLGPWGLIRIAWPLGLASGAHLWVGNVLWVLGILSVIGIVYAALIAWVQKDLKTLLAYSSVSHLAFAVLGLCAFNTIGSAGAILTIINSALSTGALFLLVGMIHRRTGTRELKQISGLGRTMPILSFFVVFFMLSSIGLPGTVGFAGEFLSLQGAFVSSYIGPVITSVGAVGIVLGAIYMLHMTASIIFGPVKSPEFVGSDDDSVRGDLTAREIGLLVPLAMLVILLGVRPGLVTDRPTNFIDRGTMASSVSPELVAAAQVK